MTGRKAFEGSDIIDTLNKTIREPVVPLTGSRQGASSELQRIVRRCLAKDPDERYQSIKDVAIELKELGHGRKTGDHAVRDIKRHKFSAVFAVIVVASLVTAFVIYHHSRATPAAVHFQSVKLARLTADGNLESVAVSADGKYIAYSVEEGGKRSLWTKHLATASRVQIVPPAEVSLLNASTFSPDGGLVYYTKVDEQNPPGALYQVPVLGGSSKKVLADGAQPISISPDGKRLAFQRVRRTGTVDELFLANVDGSGEHRILAVPEPEWLVGGSPAWSPDGQSSLPATATVRRWCWLQSLSPTGKSGPLQHGAGCLSAASGGSATAAVSYSPLANRCLGALQLWQASYPQGEVRRITNDLNAYDAYSRGANETPDPGGNQFGARPANQNL